MKTLILAVMLAATAASGGPTAAQFNAALAAACPDHRTVTRNISCARAEEGSIQFSCRYEMQGAGGGWSSHEAIVQQAEGEWVWIDGPTLCDGEDEPVLN
jgi:NAD(P)H-flavin reductase